MVHCEGGVEVELRYFLGGVGDRVKKAAALIGSKPPLVIWACQRAAVRRLFFFCRRPADTNLYRILILLLGFS